MGTPALDRHLTFRDALRADPALAGAYGDLKRTLAARLGTDRAGYTETKTGRFAQLISMTEWGSNFELTDNLIVTSNLRFGDWNSIFGDEKMTDALIGRLTHKGHIIEFVGESYRFRHRIQQEQQPEGESKSEAG